MSRFRSWLLLALLLLTSVPARADISSPGMKRPNIANRISIREAMPDYVFVVLKHRPYFATDEPERAAEFVELHAGKPIEITGHRRQNAELFVVPRSFAAKYRTALEVADAVPRIPGAGRLNLSFDESVPEWYGDDFIIDYRVKPSQSGEGIEFVRTTWRPANQCWIVGVAIPIAMMFAGLWLVRRYVRRSRAAFPKTPPPASPPA